jgi:hypothetical protein
MSTKFPPITRFRESRWYKPSLWVGALFLVYVLFGFLVLPSIVKTQLLKRLPGITKRQVAIRQVRFNPLVLSLTIRGLSLTEPDGQVFASWEELYVNFQLSSLFRLAWTFDEIGLKKPYGHVVLFKDGRFNFANMVEDAGPPQPAKTAKPGGIPRINVWKLHIDDGVVAWDDQTHELPLHVEVKPIELLLTNFTTCVGKSGQYGFEAASDTGKRLAWAGYLQMQPFQSRGHIELTGIEARKWTPLLRDYLRAEVTDGRLDVRADYEMESGTSGFGLNVRNGTVTLAQFEVKDLNTGEVVTRAPSISIEAVDFDLLGRKLHIGAVKADGYTKRVVIEKDGSLNLNMLVERSRVTPGATNLTSAAEAPKAASPPWIFAVDDFRFTNGAVSFADLSRRSQFETTLKPIEIHVQRFTTQPDSDAALDFRIPSEAGEAVSGAGTFCVGPQRAAGQLKLAALEIKKYAPYYQDLLRGEVLAGKLEVGLDYRFAAASNAPLVTISNAAVALTNFQLKAADGGETVVAIPSFTVEGGEASLATHEVQIGQVKSSGGAILARQMKDGSVNLLQLVNQGSPKASETTNHPAEGPPWTALLREIRLENYAIKLEDQKPAKPALLVIDQLEFSLKNVSTVSNQDITASLSARLNEAGRVELGGTAKIAPSMADMDVTVSGLDLRPFQPYVNEALRVGISNGLFNTRGHVRYGVSGDGGPRLKIAGEIGLTNFLATDQVRFKEFVKWDSLNVSGIDFELEPNQLRLQEVKWDGLNASIIISPDHRSNLKMILPEKPASVPAAPATNRPPEQPAGFPIELSALVLDNASFHFLDESIEPQCAFDILEMGGAVKDLSSKEQTVASVDLHGKVDAAAPFSIFGKVNPLARELTLDLAVGFTNTDLTALSSYLEKYAGHPLTKGKLSMDLHYDINQSQLKAENKFRIDHLTLGPRNDNTNASHLPVKLAVALLKDRNGRIDLDIPVTGRTDDPQFRVSPIILKAVVDLIVKAAASPFSLLGALVGGGGEELSYIEFPPGTADLPEAESKKLEKLVRALEERPVLNLDIAGSFDSERDRAALARLKLEQQLRMLRLKELARAGAVTPKMEAPQLEPSQRERLLKQVLADLGTNQTLVLQEVEAAETNALEVMTNAPSRQGRPDLTLEASASRRWRDFSAADNRGAGALTPIGGQGGSKKPKPLTKPELASGAGDVPLTVEEIEAKLVSAIQVSEDERRDLVKRRAMAVQTAILKSGKIAGDRLSILAPKSDRAIPKGGARADLSLS